MAQVEESRLLLLQESQSLDMGLGKIADVNIIADRGAIGCRVVRAENLHFGPVIQCSAQEEWDEVRFTDAMVLSDSPLGVGAGGIEVAQGDKGQAVGVLVRGQCALEGQFGLAVGVGGNSGVIFGDGDGGRLTVNRGAGRKDDLFVHHQLQAQPDGLQLGSVWLGVSTSH